MLVLGKKFEKGSNKRIKKFTYETRTTSRDFCKGLTNETIVIRDDKKITDVESISEEIKNNNWFSSSWLNDPTIKAMLNMLDSIHEIFKGEDYEDFFFPYGGEKLSQVSERMLKTCIEIMERENHNEVLALSHGVACRCFLSNFEDVDEVLKEGIPNCIIFKYEYEDKHPFEPCLDKYLCLKFDD